MDGFAALKHGDEMGDLAGARFGRLQRADAVENGVAIGAGEACEKGRRFRIGVQRLEEIGGRFGFAGGRIGRLPAGVRLGELDLSEARGPQPAFGQKLGRAAAIERRPLAARFAGRETMSRIGRRRRSVGRRSSRGKARRRSPPIWSASARARPSSPIRAKAPAHFSLEPQARPRKRDRRQTPESAGPRAFRSLSRRPPRVILIGQNPVVRTRGKALGPAPEDAHHEQFYAPRG